MGRERKEPPTPEELHQLFRCNPKHRFLIRRVDSDSAKAGDIAGHIVKGGNTSYFRVWVFGRKYFVHQIIACLMTGSWPDKNIDHKDGNGLNNKWSNLRMATRAQNSMNSKRYSNNLSGYKGVTLFMGKYWMSRIKVNGKQTFLGYFKTAEAAHTAYCKAAQELHGEFANFG